MPSKPSRRALKGFGVASLVGAVVASSTYASLTLLAPLDPVVAEPHEVVLASAEPPVLPFPDYGGSAITAIGYPGATVTSGYTGQQQMASITKIVTALVVLEEHPIARGTGGPTLTFGAFDVDRYRYQLANNGSNRPVWSGLTLSLRETLEAVLVSSANNYAESVAVWAFGSFDAFVTRASDWLNAHELLDTVVVEPSGLNPGNVSTTVDLLALGRLALQNPTIAEIVAQPTTSVPHIGELRNTNRLLGLHGIDGIKTGSLDTSNLLFSADLDIEGTTVAVVGVVLGGSSREIVEASVSELTRAVRDGFATTELVASGEVFATYDTVWGQSLSAVAARSAELLAWRGSDISSTVHLEAQRVGDADAVVGRVEFRVGDRHITVPLVLDGELTDPGPWWRLANPLVLLVP